MTHYTAFENSVITARGDMPHMIAAQRAASPRGVNLLIFDDASGRVCDVDLRDVPPPQRGRPKLGVTAREVTLLPRHWDWLTNQRGGASAAIRRLVETAARADQARSDPGRAREATYAFLQTIAGDFANYEEVLRALFAGDTDRMAELMQHWPDDVRTYALGIAGTL